jgi:hypothetical protein
MQNSMPNGFEGSRPADNYASSLSVNMRHPRSGRRIGRAYF